MPIYVSGSGGETTYGSGSMSASAGDSVLKSRRITCDRLNMNSVLGIKLGAGISTLNLAAVSSSTYISASAFWADGTKLSAGGSGDFSGPGSSTDNAVVRFNGTGGKTGQNSSVTIDDSNNVAGMGTLACGAITTTAALKGTSLSGSSTLEVVGASYFGNTLTATGSISGTAGFAGQKLVIGNQQVIDKTRNIAGVVGISGSGVLQAAGAAYFGSTMGVSGNLTVSNGNISADNGNISVGGAGTWTKGPGGGLAVSGYMSGSSTLENVGNVYIGGTVESSGSATFSGSLRAKQIHITDHHFVSTVNAKIFIPFTQKSENQTPNYQTSMIAPFNGRLLRVFIRAELVMSSYLVGIHTGSIVGDTTVNGPGVNPAYTGEHQLTESLSAATFETVQVNFTGSQHFLAKQIVGVSINPNGSFDDATVTCVWEYDMFDI